MGRLGESSEQLSLREAEETEARRFCRLDRWISRSRVAGQLTLAAIYAILWQVSGRPGGYAWMLIALIALPYSLAWIVATRRPWVASWWRHGFITLIFDGLTISAAGILMPAPSDAWLALWTLHAVYYVLRWGQRAGYLVCAVAALSAAAIHIGHPASVDWLHYMNEAIFFVAIGVLTTLMGRIAEEDRALRFRLGALAIRDGLTGLYNHRFFHEMLEREIARAERHHANVSLLFIDVDRFKALNDAHGHLVGDEALREVGRVLLDCVREQDRVFRYGGEEFAILLIDGAPSTAARVAERVHTAIRTFAFPYGKMTVSVGWSSFPHPARSATELIRQADTALYDAKRAGRDRVAAFNAARSRSG